jgi:hypothetical protein
MTAQDPFAVLGLTPVEGLGNDEVRAAWRRIATATHPDRADGGDPERFAAAAAAYTELRTAYGRGEALASLQATASVAAAAGGPWRFGARRPAGEWLSRLPGRVARGRPVRLGLRIVSTVAVAWAAVASGAPHGTGPAVAAGAATWLILTGRADLAP